MISIAVYTKKEETADSLKNLIQSYFVQEQIAGRFQIFSNMDDILTTPYRFDIYVIDMENDKEQGMFIGIKMKQIDVFGHIVYIDTEISSFCDSLKAEADCFLTKPITSDGLFPLIDKIRKMIKADTIVISTPEGDRKIRTSDLNYINIEERCLCYHLTNSEFYDGRSLRASFEKAITPLQHQATLLFLPPSLLINAENIELLNNDHLIFESGDKLYFPKK